VVAVGFYTLYYGAERRGIKASARIKKGEFVVITGKSGSGKSTLGSVINGLISHYYDEMLTYRRKQKASGNGDTLELLA